jgi:uncharacterized membrane protein YeaQ/YmgE (transglycosylase-associated protein family)
VGIEGSRPSSGDSGKTWSDLMSLIAWVVLGLIAGFIASKLVNKRGEGMLLDIVLGVVGAIVGGWLFNQFGSAGVTGFNLWSLMVAVVGAVLLLLAWHAIRGSKRRS